MRIFLLGLAAAAALPSAASAADSVKIGLVLPMSGPSAAYGKQIEHGVRLYLAQKGDVFGGRKIELLVKDDNPGTAGDVNRSLAACRIEGAFPSVLARIGHGNLRPL